MLALESAASTWSAAAFRRSSETIEPKWRQSLRKRLAPSLEARPISRPSAGPSAVDQLPASPGSLRYPRVNRWPLCHAPSSTLRGFPLTVASSARARASLARATDRCQ